MSESELERVIHPYLRDETLNVALSCYLGAGFQRAVLGVTDRRVLLVKSAYWSVRDKGLLWADPLDQVALAKGPFRCTQALPTRAIHTFGCAVRTT
jgi:hypothetical protein